MANPPETFRKSERLCSKKAIDSLFEKGISFYSYPFQIIWTKSSSDLPYPAQTAISISKRNIKSAVRRNLIKRRIREAYRKNKYRLYNFLETNKIYIVFIIIYKENKILDYHLIENAIVETINKLIASIRKKE